MNRSESLVPDFRQLWGTLTISLAVLLFSGLSLAIQAETGNSANSSKDDQLSSAQGLVKAVRESTAKFKDVHAAAPDYVLTFGCVTGPDAGAMGLHYVNFDVLKSGILRSRASNDSYL